MRFYLRIESGMTLLYITPRMEYTRTKYTGQNMPGQNILRPIIRDKIYPDNTYQTKYTGQNMPDKIYLISCRSIRPQTVDVSIRVRVKFSFRVSVRAERATEKSQKYPMAVYVRVYFKLKYTGYIFNGIFCPVYFVWYICQVYFVGIYCSLCFLPVPFILYILWGKFLSGYVLSGYILCVCALCNMCERLMHSKELLDVSSLLLAHDCVKYCICPRFSALRGQFHAIQNMPEHVQTRKVCHRSIESLYQTINRCKLSEILVQNSAVTSGNNSGFFELRHMRYWIRSMS